MRAGFFLINWKLSNNWCRNFRPAVVAEEITKISKEASIFKSNTFASYKIFLVHITTIRFEKVQLHELPVSTKAGQNNIVRLIRI